MISWRGRLTVLALITLGGLFMTFDTAQAQRPERPVLALVCEPSDAPFAPALCEAMDDVIKQEGRGYVFRRLKHIEDAPKRAGDLALRLAIERWGPISLSAR